MDGVEGRDVEGLVAAEERLLKTFPTKLNPDDAEGGCTGLMGDSCWARSRSRWSSSSASRCKRSRSSASPRSSSRSSSESVSIRINFEFLPTPVPSKVVLDVVVAEARGP